MIKYKYDRIKSKVDKDIINFCVCLYPIKKEGMIMVTIKSKREIELMREACKVVALTYKELEKAIKPGMTTW